MFNKFRNNANWDEYLRQENSIDPKLRNVITVFFKPDIIDKYVFFANYVMLSDPIESLMHDSVLGNKYHLSNDYHPSSSIIYFKALFRRPLGFPRWFIAGYPDIVLWTQNNLSTIESDPWFKKVNNELDDSFSALPVSYLRTLIDFYKTRVNKQLECQFVKTDNSRWIPDKYCLAKTMPPEQGTPTTIPDSNKIQNQLANKKRVTKVVKDPLNKAWDLTEACICDLDGGAKLHCSFRSTFNSTLRVMDQGNYCKGGPDGSKRSYLGVVDSNGEMHQVLTGLFVAIQEANPDVVIYNVKDGKAVLNTEIVFIRDETGHLTIVQ